ncbi:leucine zipper putative tumor suppressor 3 [Brienomyrus brachyistius]|uniref:leucine zipper putative tumor suppressor 3 n=1 Tax=Brienomyrus brachyistius TaxID=42636 RepID=UPI0020B220EA|nr:leucine zipper putative tumor suppressor 3 [Brienomyrus brachyistius]
MGSVGSGVAGEQEFAMKSVGTRTTLPRAPPPTRRGPSGRSCSTERPPPPPSESTASSDERGGSADRPPLAGSDSAVSESDRANSNCERQVANAVFLNGAGRREGPWAGASLDACGNNAPAHGPTQYRGNSGSKPDNPNPPKILPVSGKLEQQNNSGLVRPSAFKPVVPKSFHSMQNLVGQAGGGAVGGRGVGASGGPSAAGSQQSSDSPSGGRSGQGALSDSGRNSLTSLPTYTGSGSACGPSQALGPLSASTSHINRLGTAGANLDRLEKPGYQNGLSASDSGRSSSGKSSSSYQRLSHLSDAPQALRPSPSSDDIIQDLEDRLWEKEQEVLHMRRNLDQSEAAIVQVFEEKQRVWEREMEELRQNYAGRLQQVTRRAQRTQQALQTQIARLQQDKRRLQDDLTALLSHREELERKCLDYRKEQADILPRLEETKWEVCQKSGEISLLKQQLRESQGEVTQRAGEMVALRGQLKELNVQLKEKEEIVMSLKDSYCSKSLELERCEGELQKTLAEVAMLREKLGVFEAEVLGLKQALGELSEGRGGGATWGASPLPHGPPEPAPAPAPPPETLLSLQSDEAKVQRQEADDLRRQLERLQGELRLERQQRERQALTFAQERHTWQGEKERVLQYQAQLQLSYVEMLQKNQALEQRVGQLSSKLSPAPSPATPPSQALPVATPPSEELKPPPLHQLAPPWSGPTRLERIESTEI